MGYILILLGILLIAAAHFAKAKMGPPPPAPPLSAAPSAPVMGDVHHDPRWVVWLEAMLGPVMTVTLGWVFGGGLVFAGFILALFG